MSKRLEQTTESEIKFIKHLGSHSKDNHAVKVSGRKSLLKKYRSLFVNAEHGELVDKKIVIKYIDSQIRVE